MKALIEKEYPTPSGIIHYWTNKNPDNNATSQDEETSRNKAAAKGISNDCNGIALVFLPGLTADHRLFEQQMTYFQDKYHVLVWDAPGHHLSRPFTLNFSLMDKARWLHGILQTEGITKPVLIGQSMGGYVAQCYMECFPQEIAGFVSIDSAPLKRRYVTAAEIRMLKDCEWMYRLSPWKFLVKAGAEGCAQSHYGKRLMKEMMLSYTKNDYCTLAGHGYRMLAEAMEADLPYRISCPALLICGEKDQAASTKRYNKAWSKGESLPIFWAIGAGHNSNTDSPEIINDRIESFLQEEVLLSES